MLSALEKGPVSQLFKSVIFHGMISEYILTNTRSSTIGRHADNITVTDYFFSRIRQQMYNIQRTIFLIFSDSPTNVNRTADEVGLLEDHTVQWCCYAFLLRMVHV